MTCWVFGGTWWHTPQIGSVYAHTLSRIHSRMLCIVWDECLLSTVVVSLPSGTLWSTVEGWWEVVKWLTEYRALSLSSEVGPDTSGHGNIIVVTSESTTTYSDEFCKIEEEFPSRKGVFWTHVAFMCLVEQGRLLVEFWFEMIPFFSLLLYFW